MKTRNFFLAIIVFGLVPSLVISQPYFVNVSSQTVKPGERITATFSPISQSSAWIGFFKAGSSDRQYISFSYLSNAPNGYSVNAPTEPGNYHFSLFGDGGYSKKLATSNTVVVSASVTSGSGSPFVSVAPASVKPGERVTASFSAVDNSAAWVGFFEVGAADNRFVSYSYLRNSPNGYSVIAPNKQGQYHFRLFGDGGYNKKLATSNTLVVSDVVVPEPIDPSILFVSLAPSGAKPGERITATFSAVENSAAWVGFYEVGAADNRYISYSYLRNSPNGYTVAAPNKQGQYQFRLFGDGGYNKKLATSNALLVSDGTVPQPPATPASSMFINLSSERITLGQSVTATFSPIANQGAWIGLYKVGSTDRQYIGYVYLRNSPGGYKVNLNEPGQYEFRLFGDGGYSKKLATSKTITVTR